MSEDNSNEDMGRRPEYTEFGIKIHKLRLTLKVQKRSTSEAGRGGRGRLGSSNSSSAGEVRSVRSRASSTGGDSLRMLDLDSNAGSRRPVDGGQVRASGTRLANFEFEVRQNSDRI